MSNRRSMQRNATNQETEISDSQAEEQEVEEPIRREEPTEVVDQDK